MDRIEQLMRDAKPRVEAPGAAPESQPARSMVYSDDPNIVSLAGRTPARRPGVRRTGVRTAAAALLAAAAMAAAVVVGGNLMPPPAPGPAQTGPPAPAASATATSNSPTPSAAAPTPSPTQTALSTGGVACTLDNVDQQRSDQVRAIIPIAPAEQGYYTVLGCAGGWLAYSISDDGVRALQLDGGNAWFKIAKLQNGRFLCDVRQRWSSVLNWESQATNNEGLTPQQAMDKQFAQNGIPVELRPQLVGDGPAAG
ncbi:hypothetical protein E7Y32_15445 [Arthrobacter sp. UKPF54-2]|uniref:hypothetical protein n=1 Tax=Arthrobacter sp. UKPF54-2 TaxID=2600159 RepID=UPI0011B15891|nr:hypothetical protein [Arthrobacter sp. UKPF54-2]QDY91451.1 hypothetical protein E7Y32_15445 [Arthrobacter sp. UKPF54-2]